MTQSTKSGPTRRTSSVAPSCSGESTLLFIVYHAYKGGAVAEWVRVLAWTGDRVVLAGFESRCGNFASELWQFRLPVSFGGDTKSRRSLLSGVYARGSKISHQSALECVTVVDPL